MPPSAVWQAKDRPWWNRMGIIGREAGYAVDKLADRANPIGSEWFEDIWRDITALGSGTVLGLVTLACAGYLLMRRRYRMLALLGAATVGGTLVSLLLKSLFSRPRPEFARQHLRRGVGSEIQPGDHQGRHPHKDNRRRQYLHPMPATIAS